MRETVTHINRYGWKLTVYSHFTCEYTFSVIRHLAEMGCGEDLLKAAMENMDACDYNTGLAYSKAGIRESVVVIYRTSSFGQLVDTLSHEMVHVCGHISKVEGIDPHSEEFCELCGYLMRMNSVILTDYL